MWGYEFNIWKRLGKILQLDVVSTIVKLFSYTE